MAPLLLLPFAAIYYHPVASAVEVDWLSTPSSAQLQEVALFGLRLAEQLQARAWIDDVSRLGPLSSRDRAWLHDVWSPLLAATAVSALAVVRSVQYAATAAGRAEVFASEDGPFCTQYFSHRYEARQWVSRLP